MFFNKRRDFRLSTSVFSFYGHIFSNDAENRNGLFGVVGCFSGPGSRSVNTCIVLSPCPWVMTSETKSCLLLGLDLFLLCPSCSECSGTIPSLSFLETSASFFHLGLSCPPKGLADSSYNLDTLLPSPQHGLSPEHGSGQHILVGLKMSGNIWWLWLQD